MSEHSAAPGDDRFLLVFLCTGNRARSPLAAAFARKRLAGIPIDVASRGTSTSPDEPALEHAVSVGAELGVDLSGHRSCPLAAGELETADLVVGFEPFHVAAAVVDGGASRGRTLMLTELTDLLADVELPETAVPVERALLLSELAERGRATRAWPPHADVIDDPLGMTRQHFQWVARQIDLHVAGLAGSILGPGAHRPAPLGTTAERRVSG